MTKEKRIIIYGDFWDSYIYSNQLILIGFNGTISSYDWENIVLSKNLPEESVLAYHCAFLQSDYLYRATNTGIFEDSEFKNILQNKFERMIDLEFNYKELENFRTTKKPIELKRLTIDLNIYHNILYYCDSDGLYLKKLNRYAKNNYLAAHESKLWDCRILGLNFGYAGRLGLAASSEGLFEMNSFEYDRYPEDKFRIVEKVDDYTIYQISQNHSSYCSWSYSSLFSGSYVGESELFGFKRIVDRKRTNNNYELSHLDYRGEFNEEQIFSEKKSDSIIISGNEKIYRLGKNSLEAVNYSQNGTVDSSPFKLIGTQMIPIEEQIIEAAVVEFGVVVETNKRLMVLLSTGEYVNLLRKTEDRIVRWRVFPRSNCYINQLHVIFNDRIEIISFNDDYFVNQKSKTIGQRYLFTNRL